MCVFSLLAGNKVANWKEMPGVVGNANMARNSIQCPPGAALQQNRLSGANINTVGAAGSVPGMKPDQPLWNHPRCVSVFYYVW